MLTWFHLPLGHKKTQSNSRVGGMAGMYKEFIDPKWFAAHNTLSEILRKKIPQEVLDCKYELGSDELKKGIKQFKKKHPHFPQGD